MMRYAAAALSVLALAACNGQEPESDRRLKETGSPAPASAPATKPDLVAEPSDPTATPPEVSAFASSYTDFDLKRCTIVRQELEEGSSADFTCPAANGVAVFAQDGDGRLDLDFGVNDSGFQTYGGFNNLAEQIEWRERDGTPFAAIFRYRDATEQGRGMTVLAVETIGKAGAPGCRLAQISGDTANANAKAREIADAGFGKTSCGATRYIGSYAR